MKRDNFHEMKQINSDFLFLNEANCFYTWHSYYVAYSYPSKLFIQKADVGFQIPKCLENTQEKPF